MKKTLYIFLIWFNSVLSLVAQEDARAGQKPGSGMGQIPALNVLIDSALVHSPLLKAGNLEIEELSEMLSSDKKEWLNNIFLQASANYGMYDQVEIKGIQGEDASGYLSQREQFNYYAGAGLKIPIGDLLSRKNKIKVTRLQMEQKRYELDAIKMQIKNTIITEYYKLVQYQASLESSFDIFQTLEISYLKAKNDLENDRINLNDFATLVTNKGKALEQYEKTKANYYAQYRILEIITGMQFNLNE